MCNDIDKLGKQMPYTVPEGFFPSMEQSIRQAVEKDRQKRRRALMAKWSISVAAAAVAGVIAMVALKPVPTCGVVNHDVMASNNVANDSTEVYMSDELLDEWITLSENDEFINCENEMENITY